MKNTRKKLPILLTAGVVAFLLSIYTAASVRAAEPTPSPCMEKWCSRMIEMHEDFLKMLQNQDADLAALVNKIKASTGPEKQNLIEATLLLMIQQQSAQHAAMEKMITSSRKTPPKADAP